MSPHEGRRHGRRQHELEPLELRVRRALCELARRRRVGSLERRAPWLRLGLGLEPGEREALERRRLERRARAHAESLELQRGLEAPAAPRAPHGLGAGLTPAECAELERALRRAWRRVARWLKSSKARRRAASGGQDE